MVMDLQNTLSEKALDTPLLRRISDLAHDLVNIRFATIFHKDDDWILCRMTGSGSIPEFCRMMQSTPTGAKQCHMFHELLCLGTCGRNNKATAHTCPAGLATLVCPVDTDDEAPIAILTTCFRTRKTEPVAWKAAKERGKILKLDLKKLKIAYNALPTLTQNKMELAEKLLLLATDAVALIETNCLMKEEGLSVAVKEQFELLMRQSRPKPITENISAG
jgi:ligand-binding sensor protein